MKRSEMLKIIERAFGNHPLDYPSDVVAENILCHIEEAGMVPPLILNPNFKGGHMNDIYPYYINEWEQENE